MTTRRANPEYLRRTHLGSLLKMVAVPICLFLATAVSHGQSALDGFDPGANELIFAVAVQPDGKIVIGGRFTSVAGVARNRIARLNSDGSLDASFNPGSNGEVYALVAQPDGKIVVGGIFSNLGGVARGRIGRLNQDGTTDVSFNPGANIGVYALAIQGDGKILVGGGFTTLGGGGSGTTPIVRIGRLFPDGALDGNFNPGADATIYSLSTQADGKILVGGGFFHLGGGGSGVITRNRIARVNVDGTLDAAFDPGADGYVSTLSEQADGRILVGGSFATLGGGGMGVTPRQNIGRLHTDGSVDTSFDPGANAPVPCVVTQTDGKILVGGSFTTLGGGGMGNTPRNYIGRLNPDGTVDPGFDPNADNALLALAKQADGKIVVAGAFTALAPNGGATVTRNRIARLETDGRLDRTLDLQPIGNFILATAFQPDGKILIGGRFTNVRGVTRNNVARLNTDGTLDTAFNPNANFSVFGFAVQPDGKILAVGDFTQIGGQPRNLIARLDATTGLADSFNANAVGGGIYLIALQVDGGILVAGNFTGFGGQTRNNVARLDPTTGLADSFNPNADGRVFALAQETGGKILVGGEFFNIGGQTRLRLARLDPVTGLADAFAPNPDDWVLSLAVQPDGKILVGGNFSSIGGQLRNRIARLDPNTGLADLFFNPNADLGVYSIAIQADARIFVAGYFVTIGGQPRNGFARLSPTKGLVDSFNPGGSGQTLSLALQTDGKILATGEFESIGGQPRSKVARLTNDTAAQQGLFVAKNSISWNRDGSSPQFVRVIFEYSTDDVNYTLLGHGTPSGNNWILTGLNLLPGQNFYVRARGYSRSGYLNSSESVTESKRYGPSGSPPPNPTATATATPTATVTPTATATPTLAVSPTPTPSPSPTATATGTPIPTPTPTPTVTPSPGVCGWTNAPTVPVPVSGAVTSVGGNLYSFGGTGDGTTSFKFDGTTWTGIAPLPEPLGGFAAVSDDAYAYLVGGYGSSGENGNTLYRYDPTANSYTKLAPLAHPLSSHTAVYLNGKIYKFCGYPGSIFASDLLEIYDIATNTWSDGPNCLIYGFSVAGFAQGGFVYAAGGYAITTGAIKKTCRYDPSTNTWSDQAIADLPVARSGPVAATYQGKGVLAGGAVGAGVGTLSASVISWDPVSNTWSDLPSLLGERGGAGGAVLNGSLYVVGGSSGSGSTNDNQRLTCPPPQPSPTPTAMSTATPTATPTATVPASTLGNVSTRLRVETGDNALIGGFIVTGTQPKKVIVRALGPSLPVDGALSDPVLELRSATGALVATNDNWRSTQEAEIIATTIPPSNDMESAIVATLPANGSAYTAIVRGVDGGTGVGVVEAYDLDRTVDSKLANISTRGFVQSGDDVMIGGFIVAGQGSQRVIVRALGPSIPVGGALGDPTLELRDGNGGLVAVNDNWRSDQEAEIIATTLAPASDLESAIVRTLPANGAAYTAIVRGIDGTIGVAVVEVYALN